MRVRFCLLLICGPALCLPANAQQAPTRDNIAAVSLDAAFQQDVNPLLKQFCITCHGEELAEAGIRIDLLNSRMEDRQLRLWQAVRRHLAEQTMPPKEETQPSETQRSMLLQWIDDGLHLARTQPVQNNGSVRRLTVAQYRNSLRDLLGLREDLTDVLPPDAVSKDGFTNNAQSQGLSPLQVEAWFAIAEQALDLCIVDEDRKPAIQKFRMDLGRHINPEPFPEKLILGANNHLLNNSDFIVTQPLPRKPFDFQSVPMRTRYRFHEGYEGNATVRGWRDYDSIYHAVFACMRGKEGYPKGKAYETIPEGLLLRPAIPSAEVFGQESTYGPQANFKISLRELPREGNFRVTVTAARYDDGLLLNGDEAITSEPTAESLTITNPRQPQTIEVASDGIYRVDVSLADPGEHPSLDASQLEYNLIGYWPLNNSAVARDNQAVAELTDGAAFVKTPFGMGVSVDGRHGSVKAPRNENMNVGDGDFTVAAWIRPRELRQGGIVCLGKYSWTHGWYLDMPNKRGVLRIETANSDNQPNGTVSSPPDTIRINKWQHVAAVVRRGDNQTRLFVNGYQVAEGSIAAANLDNPNVNLHIGRIQDAQLFNGDIDEVRIYRRALQEPELQALIEPGRQFASAPLPKKPQSLSLQLNDRHFSGTLNRPAFMIVRLRKGPLTVAAHTDGPWPPGKLTLTPLPDTDPAAGQFLAFEKRPAYVGVHLGLRRDCGSTVTRVGKPQPVTSSTLNSFVFDGAINDYPNPDVEENNDNYLAGVRDLCVRSEFTDGRDRPRLLIRCVEFEGPFFESWPPSTHQNIFPESIANKQSEQYAREVIARFASRAFRRPLTDGELASLLAVWKEAFAATDNFQQSVKDALLVVLTSPQFLMLTEESHSPEPEPLSEYELASKLSYFLWNTAPDERLRQLAEQGTLRQSLAAETERLIGDVRFEQFTQQFVSQWLSLQKLDIVETNAEQFPTLTRHAKRWLRHEPVQFIQFLIRENLPARNLIQSEWLVANEVVASYYHLNHLTDSGFAFMPVKHENDHLGGVLTQAGILAGLSDGREPNPVKRGAWLARKIIAEPPDDPPPNVPALDEDTSQLTLRERLEKHRNQPGCRKCHEGIDPWGVAFEQFDAGGLFRRDSVDATSTLPDGTTVTSLSELKQHLSEARIDSVALSLLKHLSSYAIGRSLTYNEIELLKKQTLELRDTEYRMQQMIQFVVHSDLFLNK